jgi:predicted naringenin-chalcone synthase
MAAFSSTNGMSSAQRRFARTAQADQRDTAMAGVTGFRWRQRVPRGFPHAGQIACRQLCKPLNQLRELCGARVASAARIGMAVDLRQHHGQWHVQRVGHLPQQQHRCVAGAGFEIGEIAFRYVRAARQILARHAACRAQ